MLKPLAAPRTDRDRANDVWETLSPEERRAALRRIDARPAPPAFDLCAYAPDPDREADGPRPVPPVADLPDIQWMHRRPARAVQAVKVALSFIGLALIVAAVLR